MDSMKSLSLHYLYDRPGRCGSSDRKLFHFRVMGTFEQGFSIQGTRSLGRSYIRARLRRAIIREGLHNDRNGDLQQRIGSPTAPLSPANESIPLQFFLDR